jgi:hypothetical protein
MGGVLRFIYRVLQIFHIRIEALNPQIVGMEVTQAIQFNRFHADDPLRSSVLVDGAARPSNSLTLIEGKPTLLRVFTNRGSAETIDSFHLLGGSVVRRGQPGAVRELNRPESLVGVTTFRTTENPGLCFLLPPEWAYDDIRLDVELFAIDEHTGAPRYDYTASTSLRVHFEPVARPRVQGVMIEFHGNGLDLPAPNGLRLVDSFVDVIPTYPIQGLDYGPCTVMPFSGDLAQLSAWNALVQAVDQQRALGTDPDCLMVGLLPSDIKNIAGRAADGIGGGGLFAAVAIEGNFRSLRHEIGHAFGRDHVPGSGAAPYDLAYPNYGSYPFGSIGEFGIDVHLGAQLISRQPADTKDMMTYVDAAHQWVSPHTWDALFNAILNRFGDGVATIPFVDPMPKVKSLSIAVTEDERGALQLQFGQVLDLSTRFHTRQENGEVSLQLVDRDGVVLRRQACGTELCTLTDSEPRLSFLLRTTWHVDTSAVRVQRSSKTLAEWTVSADEPVIAWIRVDREQEDRCLVHWQVSHPTLPVQSALRYTNDGGRTWIGVRADVREDRTVVAMAALPGGEECRFELIASAGFRTVTMSTASFPRPRRARTAVILRPPAEGTSVPVGTPILFAGGAHSPDFGLAPEREVHWQSDIEGPVTSGVLAWITFKNAGEHLVTLNAPDGMGGRCEARIRVMVGNESAGRTVGTVMP